MRCYYRCNSERSAAVSSGAVMRERERAARSERVTDAAMAARLRSRATTSTLCGEGTGALCGRGEEGSICADDEGRSVAHEREVVAGGQRAELRGGRTIGGRGWDHSEQRITIAIECCEIFDGGGGGSDGTLLGAMCSYIHTPHTPHIISASHLSEHFHTPLTSTLLLSAHPSPHDEPEHRHAAGHVHARRGKRTALVSVWRTIN